MVILYSIDGLAVSCKLGYVYWGMQILEHGLKLEYELGIYIGV